MGVGYVTALKMAGATVHEFEQFGSYQGDWWAKITYKDVTGWINGSYGSCSSCDAFEGEFGYFDSHYHENGDYISPYDSDCFDDSCPACRELKKRLIDFGEDYLDNILTYEEAVISASSDIDWDYNAKEVVEFIKKHK